MNKYNLKVGQVLYVMPEWQGRGGTERQLEEYAIEKVGRVWAKLKHRYYRVNIETLTLDGRGSSVYLSPQQYKDERELTAGWRDFCIRVREVEYRRPSHMTLELINEARAKLGI